MTHTEKDKLIDSLKASLGIVMMGRYSCNYIRSVGFSERHSKDKALEAFRSKLYVTANKLSFISKECEKTNPLVSCILNYMVKDIFSHYNDLCVENAKIEEKSNSEAQREDENHLRILQLPEKELRKIGKDRLIDDLPFGFEDRDLINGKLIL